MRWTDPEPPKLGEYRECSGFLWFPRCIDNETRWLEFAAWKQKYVEKHPNQTGATFKYCKWEDFCWENDDE